MTKKVLFIAFVVILFSCKQEKNPENYNKLIVGDWEKIPAPPQIDPVYGKLPSFHIPAGYSFSHDGSCEVKQGISDYNEKLRSKRYLGTFTTYKIFNDSVKMYNPFEKKWFALKINKLAGDTLVLDSIRFIRKKYDISKIPDFDAVVVSASPCYGSCPINNILINNDGSVIYRGLNFNTTNGNYSSTISRAEFNKIMMRFKKANYTHLNNEYSEMVTDNATVSIVFIKDGKIIKSISDYASSSPQDLIWAYEPLIYLSQQLKLTPLEVPEYLQSRLFTSFKKSVTSLNLTQAEAFYLSNELQKGTVVPIQFNEKYSFTHNEASEKITTDGRYYKFYFKDKTTKTIDIGYNFLTNKLVQKFQKKHE
jgi:hypothetical protein